MNKDLKQLSKDTAIYGISTIIGRFWNFLLVPLYTNIFSQSEYGIVTNIYAIIALLNVIYLYGIDSAYMKYATSKEGISEKVVFSNSFLTLIISSFLLSILIVLFQSVTVSVFEIDYFQVDIIYYVALIIFFDTINMVPFARLRLQNKALVFALIKTFNILLNIILNIYFIYYLHYNIEGVFLSGMIASTATFIILIPYSFKGIKFTLDKNLLIMLLKFGLPFVPAGLASMMVQVINRPIMLFLTDASTVGVFQANYKLGIFMMLVVSMFQYAWQPFFLNNSTRSDAKELFSKVFTLFTLFSSFIFLLLSLFIEDIVKLNISGKYLVGKEFWGGLYIVPIILLGYLFNGFYVNFMAGIQITKQTKYLPIISGAGALITVITNFVLIPPFGMLGAAIAMLLSYISMAYLIYRFSQKFYLIKYEWNKILMILVSLLIVLAFIILTYSYTAIDKIIIKLLSIILFSILITAFKLVKLNKLDFIKFRK